MTRGSPLLARFDSVPGMATPDDMMQLTLGQRWTEWVLPQNSVSAAWQRPHMLLISVPDPDPRIAMLVANSTVKVGLLQTGSVAVLLLRTLPLGTIECPRPYLVGDPEPEVSYGDGEHILWNMVLVQANIITNMRAFTTSPQMTKHIRRIFSEQRAEGPVTTEQFDSILDRWRETVQDERMAWARCLVTCNGGD
jgi:hypothetical protein